MSDAGLCDEYAEFDITGGTGRRMNTVRGVEHILHYRIVRDPASAALRDISEAGRGESGMIE
jgi:hypothetical protein